MNAAVEVAGRGAVTPFGAGVGPLVAGVFAGRTAVRARERSAAFRAPTTVAAELPSGACALRGHEADPLDCALRAAREALAEAGEPERRSLGLVLATTKGELAGLVDRAPASAGYGLPARLARALAERLEIGGPSAVISCACASGLLAIGAAERRLTLGAAERVLVVGVDVLSEFVLAGFGALRALDPEACRPFDAERRGISIGEAACALVLSRRADESIGVRVVGHAGANDARHPTRPDDAGRGVELAAGRALVRAGLEPTDVDAIHLHGTGTRRNDESEAAGLARLFGGRTPPAFGTKAQTGHTLGASGVLESILAIEALVRGRVPANHALVRPDVDPGLDLVREPRTLASAHRCLKISSGFGGIQSAIVLEADG